MAYLKQTKSEEEIKKMTISNVRKSYNDLAVDYNKILNGEIVRCDTCGEWVVRTNFYPSNNNVLGLYPTCKKCVLAKVEQRDKKNDKPNETKDSVQKMLRSMDLPYIDSLYESCKKSVADEVNEKNRKSPFLQMITILKSLPQYRGKTYENSEFLLDDESNPDYAIKVNQKTLKNAKKRFGAGYGQEDLMFLENEYQDWISRYQCDTKSQEEVFQSLSTIKLLKRQAIKSGKSTKELDKTFQEWLDTGNLKPKQNTMDTLSDAQTFGTLIQKYEETRPLPEIDPELEDVDKIGLYIDAFYRGHASKMLGLKNSFSHLYEKVMSKYTVNQPQYDEETDSEILFDKIFGSVEDE